MVAGGLRYFRIFSCKPLTRLCLHLLLISIFGIIFYTLSFRWRNADVPLIVDSDHTGPGEYGEPTHYDSEEKDLVDESYKLYGFNQHVSDKISLTRMLKDYRHPECSQLKYNSWPTTVSVIIVFYDEGWSTLIRTVMSVINRSPQDLLYEIILVDDHSTMKHLKEKLDDFAKNSKEMVKIVRCPAHEGLIRARISGADAARGSYLVFLDSHCEVTTGWLEPLIAPIQSDYRTVTCPTIDGIEHSTFEYKPYGGKNGETARGTFSWQFYYKEKQLTDEQKKNRKSAVDPVESPVMAGGLFAISAKWWLMLGKYDPEMYVWGGEQYEISFKIWQCKGSMLNVPCSRVGHVYRGPGLIRDDQGLNHKHPNSVNRNYKRVAEIWMDNYKNFLYAFKPEIGAITDYGEGLDKRLEIKTRLKCHNFKWYLKNVIKDTLRTAYEPDRAWDRIKNINIKKCLNFHKNTMILSPCNSAQSFRWTWINEIREDEHCMLTDGKKIKWDWCHEKQGNQHFLFNKEKGWIYSDTYKLCLSSNDNENIILSVCQESDKNQKWHVNLRDLSIPEPWAINAIHEPRDP